MSRILVAEDEPRIASFVAKGLTASGLVPEVSGDGASALALALTLLPLARLALLALALLTARLLVVLAILTVLAILRCALSRPLLQ